MIVIIYMILNAMPLYQIPIIKEFPEKYTCIVSLTVVDIGPVGLVTYAILVCVNSS